MPDPVLPKLWLKPDCSNYQSVAGSNTVQLQLDGGPPRGRTDYLDAPWQITVNWVLDGRQYDYLMAFWRKATNFGALPFLIELVIDKSCGQDYVCYFQDPGNTSSNSDASSNGFGITSQAGDSYVVQATLLAIPDVEDNWDQDGDQALIDQWAQSQ